MVSHTRFVIGEKTSIQDIRSLSGNVNTIDLIINKSILVVADVGFYIENEQEIKSWSNQSLTSFSQNGMILGFVNDEERNLFLMRWS